MPKKLDYLGRRFNMLLVVAPAPNTKQGASAWYCVCDCGTGNVYARSTDLRRGDCQSCGCSTGRLIRAANSTHGLSKTRLYKCWRAMHDRCSNANVNSYRSHGARGITVCTRWRTFENFASDMGERPPGYTLERMDNDKGYSPGNCYWATKMEQANNKRTNRRFTVDGANMTLAQLARAFGHPPLRVWYRLKQGWDIHTALMTPPLPRTGSLKGKAIHISSLDA